jgi:hypothetical protein
MRYPPICAALDFGSVPRLRSLQISINSKFFPSDDIIVELLCIASFFSIDGCIGKDQATRFDIGVARRPPLIPIIIENG